MCESPHDHIAASEAQVSWWCDTYGDELLHSNCSATFEVDEETAGIGQCGGDRAGTGADDSLKTRTADFMRARSMVLRTVRAAACA